MSDSLTQIEELLPRLTLSERMLLVDKLTGEIKSGRGSHSAQPAGIDLDPDICGGEPRIIRTRIPVWLLEQARRLGKTDTELLAVYPSLRADDLAHAWAYVAQHPEEVQRQIEENEAA